MLFISLILSAIAKKNEKHQVEFDSISSIKELLEYYDCKYLGEADGIENGYRFDVFTEFKYPLYKDDNTSNEEFYTKLINDAARVMKYYSFRLIDEKKLELVNKHIRTNWIMDWQPTLPGKIRNIEITYLIR